MKSFASILAAAAVACFALPAAAQVVGPSTPGTLKVGFIPAEDSRAMVRHSQAVMDIVAKSTGMKIEAFVGSDYNATIEALRSNKVDVALLGPFSYVLATTQAPVEAFAITVTAKNMSPNYQSIIITRADSDISSLQTLKGRTFAFVDPGSTSGGLMPSAALHEAGIVPEKDLKKVMYSGGHDATIIAVAEGKVEAGAVADRILVNACDKKLIDCAKVKTVWKSPPIPNDPLLYRKNLPEDLKAKIRAGFAEVKNLQFGEMGTVARFDPATDKDYDVIRKIASTLKLDLSKMK